MMQIKTVRFLSLQQHFVPQRALRLLKLGETWSRSAELGPFSISLRFPSLCDRIHVHV